MENAQSLSKDTSEPNRSVEERLERFSVKSPVNAEEAQNLLRELQAQKIELEIRNQELCYAETIANEVLTRYTDFYDFAPVGYLTLDSDGVIHMANLTAATMLMLDRLKLIGQSLESFVSAESQLDLKVFLHEACAIHSTGRQKFECELTLAGDSGAARHVHIGSFSARSSGECRIVMTDITERMNLQNALKEKVALAKSLNDSLASSCNELNYIMENNPDILYVFNTENRLIKWNTNLEKFCGLPPDQMMNRPAAEFVCEEDRQIMGEKIKEVFEKGLFTAEVRLVRHDGALVPFICNGVMIENLGGEMTGFSGTGRDISERKAYEEKIQRLAYYDTLTSLPNRALLYDRLKQALATAKRDKKRLAVMFLDLNRFKSVNDTFGHGIGDMLLKEVAKRIQDCLRESDTAARMGGDEFVVLLPNTEADQDALVVAEKICDAIDQPFDLAGHSLHVSSSIGIAVYPENGSEGEALLKYADNSMYCSKGSEHNN